MYVELLGHGRGMLSTQCCFLKVLQGIHNGLLLCQIALHTRGPFSSQQVNEHLSYHPQMAAGI